MTPSARETREILHIAKIETPIGSIRLASTSAGRAYVELPRASGRGFTGWLRRHLPDAECREGCEKWRQRDETWRGVMAMGPRGP